MAPHRSTIRAGGEGRTEGSMMQRWVQDSFEDMRMKLRVGSHLDRLGLGLVYRGPIFVDVSRTNGRLLLFVWCPRSVPVSSLHTCI